MTPRISVITPSFNQGEWLEATIQSVLAQNYPNLEFIVMDGGSADNSVAIIKKYTDQLAYWVSEPDGGQSAGINKGLARATGDILTWINSDDTLEPNCLARVVEVMCLDRPMLVHGSNRLIDEAGNTLARPILSKRRREFSRETVIDDGLVNQPGTFWNRAAQEKVGLLDESLRYVMDFEYWVRMALAGAEIVRLSDPPLATYRLASDTKTIAGMYKQGLEHIAMIDTLLADPNLPTKTGLSAQQLAQKARRAKGLSATRVWRGYLRVPGQRWQAVRWFLRSVAWYPPSLLLYPEYVWRKLALWFCDDAPSW